jgi:hypothetical protein
MNLNVTEYTNSFERLILNRLSFEDLKKELRSMIDNITEMEDDLPAAKFELEDGVRQMLWERFA